MTSFKPRFAVQIAYLQILSYLGFLQTVNERTHLKDPWSPTVAGDFGQIDVHSIRKAIGFRPPDSWNTDEAWKSAWQVYTLHARHLQNVPPFSPDGLPPWQLDQDRSCTETPWMDADGNTV